jgi:hypothetical protein
VGKEVVNQAEGNERIFPEMEGRREVVVRRERCQQHECSNKAEAQRRGRRLTLRSTPGIMELSMTDCLDAAAQVWLVIQNVEWHGRGGGGGGGGVVER